MSFVFFESIAQIGISKTYQSNDLDLFSSDKYKNAITRQHSVSINLKDFVFTEVRDGDYVVSLKLRFLKYKPGSSEPEVKSQANMIFYDDDVIKTYTEEEIVENGKKKKKKRTRQHVQLSLENKLVGFNYVLIDVTHIEVTVRLTKIKDEFDSFKEMINPILNVAVKTPETVNLVDNLLDGIKSDEDLQPLLFSAELYIPANIFDYEQQKGKDNSRIIDNNEEFGILLEGNTAINDNSIVGKGKEILNRTTKFFSGKSVVKKETVNLAGLLTMNFTKDEKAVIPEPILTKFDELDGYLTSPNLEQLKN